jgi:hypothetical protein
VDRARRWVCNSRVSATRCRLILASRLGAVVALVREALQQSFTGSRGDLVRTIGERLDVGLLVIFLGGRGIHLLQALLDVTLGLDGYTHMSAAQIAACGCLAESLLLSVALARRQRLTLPLLVADAAFGLLGLGILSFATTHTVGRTGTIDWMLPYTVTTVAGLGLLVGRGKDPVGPDGVARGRGDWRCAPIVLILTAGYVASVMLPRLAPGETAVQVLVNACNYPAFYLGAAGLSLSLRRRLEAISVRNDAVTQEAARVAAQGHLRAMMVDVFGPVFDLLERAAKMGDEVPPSLREEASRLMELIDAMNPRAGGRGPQ